MADPISPAAFAAMAEAERKATISKLSRDEQAALLKQLTPAQMIQQGKAALVAMGPYEAQLTKQERVRGKVLPGQTMRIQIREQPFAARVEVIDGPSKGRKVLFNPNVKPGQIRAKEAGLLGIAGAVWVDMNGSLAKGDTEHVVTDLGFGSVLKIIENDEKASEKFGGQSREDEGFNARGLYCMRFVAPKAATGLYAHKAKICFDPVLALPCEIEVEDAQGFKEKLSFSNVQKRDFSENDFQPKSFGL